MTPFRHLPLGRALLLLCVPLCSIGKIHVTLGSFLSFSLWRSYISPLCFFKLLGFPIPVTSPSLEASLSPKVFETRRPPASVINHHHAADKRIPVLPSSTSLLTRCDPASLLPLLPTSPTPSPTVSSHPSICPSIYAYRSLGPLCGNIWIWTLLLWRCFMDHHPRRAGYGIMGILKIVFMASTRRELPLICCRDFSLFYVPSRLPPRYPLTF